MLVVDDDPASRAVLAALLRQARYECDEARDGEEAIELAGRVGYRAVLLDLHMPGVDGFETARRLLAGGVSGGIAILAVSTDDRPATVDRCLALGMQGLLRKPIGARRLVDALEGRLDPPRPAAGGAGRNGGGSRSSLDLSGALRRLGGDPGLLRLQLELVVAEAPALLAELVELTARGDCARRRAVAHRLRGLFASCDGADLAAEAARHEQHAAGGSAAPADARPFAARAEAFLGELRRHLGQTRGSQPGT